MRRMARRCLLLSAIALPACGGGSDEAPSQPGPDWRQPAVDLELAPVRTFAMHCARCHGDGGAMYPRPFRHRGEDLRRVIEEMMVGPAQLDPTEAEVEAMLAYHRTMRRETPFAVAANAGSVAAGNADALRGEATAGARVVWRAEGRQGEARREGRRWRVDAATLPSMSEARSGEASYRVELAE